MSPILIAAGGLVLLGNTAAPNLFVRGEEGSGAFAIRVEGDLHGAPTLVIQEGVQIVRLTVRGQDTPEPVVDLASTGAEPLGSEIDLDEVARPVNQEAGQPAREIGAPQEPGGPIRHPGELGVYNVRAESADGTVGYVRYEIVRSEPAGYLSCGGPREFRRP
jgi:hypothetical protein